MNISLILAICCAAFVALMIVIILVRITNKSKSGFAPVGVLCVVGAFIATIGTLVFGYFSQYYHATTVAKRYLDGGGDVRVRELDGAYLFDGRGEDSAIIFFQGGKVESEAYAPLMFYLAENGVDCFLIDAPFNIPMFGTGTADKLLEENSYSRIYLAGHSLGGVAASSYLSSHTDNIEGLILLASYPMSRIDDPLSVLSVYGTNDGCLDQESYREAQSLMPSDYTEKILEGGNHAQFGDYGEQEGDHPATLTPEEQRTLTVDAILGFIEL